MSEITSLIAFADFIADSSLDETAASLSRKIFAGIRFIPDPGGWDEVPCLRLEQDFMGLRVQLGGDQHSGYSVELDTILSASVEVEPPNIGDISAFLKHQLSHIPGITITPHRI